MVHGFIVGGIDFVRVVAATVQRPDFVVGHVGNEGFEFGGVEEVLAHIRAVFGFEGLVVAVETFFHALFEGVVGVAGEQAVPAAAPDNFQHVPARATEVAFQLLDDFAVAAHRAVEALQVAVDDENQVVQAFAGGQRDRALAFGFVHFAVAAETPHFAAFGFGQAARFQILQETRLINRHQRAQTHRYGGELPKIGQQVRVRVGGQTFAGGLLAEVVELFVGEAAFNVGAGVEAGRGVALNVDQIAFFAGRFVFGAPEVVEAHVVQGGGRLEGGDVAAQFQIFLARAQHHRRRVPADDGADAVFELVVAGRFLLFAGGNGVQIGGRRIKRQVHPAPAGVFHQVFQ